LQNPYHLYSNPDNYTVTLRVTGPGGEDTVIKTDYIKIPFRVAPSPLDFGRVYIGSSKTLPLEITNHTLTAVNVIGLSTPLVYGQMVYRLVAPPSLPYTMQPNGGNKLTVQIEFKPPDISNWSGTLEVSTASSTTPEFEVILIGFGDPARALLPWLAPLLGEE
jgi:PKD repeat protein